MKTNILSLLALAGLLSFAGCASDDTTNKPNEQEPGTEGLTSFVEEDNTTRTTGEYDGSGLNFYWTQNDRLWVNNGGTLTQDSKNNINAKLENNPANSSAVQRAATAKFWFAGTFTNTSYPVRYTGKNGASNKVTIKAAQSQNIPNDASHIGEDGDFGVATATKPIGGDKYHFTLDHKAAYITFMPYTTQSWGPNAVIQKIRVFTGNTSDALAGTFDLADDGTLSNPASTSNSVELAVNNFSIPSTETYATNGVTMVVNPGAYSNVSIEYTLHDPVTHVTGTITKTYASVKFTAGKNKKVKTDLQVTIYPGNPYYQWDAQQHYWASYEWDGTNPTQPTVNGQRNKADAPQSTMNTSAHTPRDFNDVQGYHDPTGVAPAVLPTTSHFQALPNINECIWYCMKGDPHWDTELWATMNHLYKGGMWFKKKSKISSYSTNHAPNGIDYARSTSIAFYDNSPISTGKPSNLSDYFYLPALGWYNDPFGSVGFAGFYWVSTPEPGTTNKACYLYFDSSRVRVNYYYRCAGMRMWKADDSDGKYRPLGL
ncbi:hypothetical protein [Hoylesella enoeca]|uniref:Fimbrillin family protein n=1 Tax=Hoylesella enoeca TaxID=76123 RepID=A0A0S2KKX3_9BACT|nr:hypothetical protein [Hoylesella enoeca]ALO48755.1 hypothetical protein AS203_06400 [Hoylesella enoeca]